MNIFAIVNSTDNDKVWIDRTNIPIVDTCFIVGVFAYLITPTPKQKEILYLKYGQRLHDVTVLYFQSKPLLKL
jgi:hypothetical protein